MRKLMWFTIGFAVGCGLCAYVLPESWIIPSVFLVAGLMAVTIVLQRKWKLFCRLAMACFGCILGLCWFFLFHQYYLSPAVQLDGEEQTVTITATDYSYETEYGLGVDGTLKIEGKTYQIRAYIQKETELAPGDMISGRFRFRTTTPEGEKGSTYHSGEGIFLLAYQLGDIQITKAERIPQWAFAAQIREQIKGILDANFSEKAGAFAKALLLGSTEDLSYETDTDLQISGIRHVAAVSGLHISILFALISVVSFRKRYAMTAFGLPMLLLFAALAGFTPSVIRACIMSALMLLASLFDRDYDGATSLSFASLVMLAGNPLVITSVSFQLSIASVAGILLFHSPIHQWLSSKFPEQKNKVRRRIQDGMLSSISVSLSAMPFTTPLCAGYFGTVSLVGAVTNLLTLWIISFVFYGLMAVCILSVFWQGGAVLFAKIISLPIQYVLLCAKVLADFPLAAVYTQNVYVVVWLIFCYLLFAIFLLQKKRQPVVLLCCVCLGLCISLLAGWMEPMMRDTRLTVLDVGQGQSILLQHDGKTYLIDCGGESDEETADLISQTLLSQGIHRLDGIILTHYDSDHAGSLENLLTRIQTDLLLVPDTVDARPFPQVDGSVCYVNEDLQITFGEARITVFGPIYSGSSNENSLCVLFESEECDILITGDRSDFGERMLMRHADLPDVDLLIAGHHGAKDSTSVELLQKVTPETVIISVGRDNIYGHPNQELLDRLEEFGCIVYRTDENGTIIYRR